MIKTPGKNFISVVSVHNSYLVCRYFWDIMSFAITWMSGVVTSLLHLCAQALKPCIPALIISSAFVYVGLSPIPLSHIVIITAVVALLHGLKINFLAVKGD